MSRPFHIYLDLEVRNDDVYTTSRPPPLSFEETRLQPFLDGDASDYFCTIARFTLQTSNSLPVFIPTINTNQIVVAGQQPFINETIYKISFYEQADPSNPTASRQLVQLNVIYVPSDQSIPLPRPPVVEQDLTSEYYYVRNYSDFIDMINTTLSTLFVNIMAIGHYNPPYMEWDNASCTASLYADTYYFDLNGNTNPFTGDTGRIRKFEIYFNTRLYQLFSTLNATYVGKQNVGTGGLDYRMDFFGNASNTVKLPQNDSNGNSMYNVVIAQEISTIGVWSPIESIVFTSTSLPIQPSLSSAPKVISNGDNSTSGNGQPNISNILTDFQISVTAANQYRPEISYVPSGEYRLVDMFSNSNLSRVDLSVYWRDKRGFLNPILLYPGCSASVKLLFRSKWFNVCHDV